MQKQLVAQEHREEACKPKKAGDALGAERNAGGFVANGAAEKGIVVEIADELPLLQHFVLGSKQNLGSLNRRSSWLLGSTGKRHASARKPVMLQELKRMGKALPQMALQRKTSLLRMQMSCHPRYNPAQPKIVASHHPPFLRRFAVR